MKELMGISPEPPTRCMVHVAPFGCVEGGKAEIEGPALVFGLV